MSGGWQLQNRETHSIISMLVLGMFTCTARHSKGSGTTVGMDAGGVLRVAAVSV